MLPLSHKENYFCLTITIIYIIIILLRIVKFVHTSVICRRSILKYKTIISDHGAFPSVLETCTHIISRPKTLFFYFILLPKLIIIIITTVIIICDICKGVQTAHQDLSMITFT